jgi:hypothetical protein
VFLVNEDTRRRHLLPADEHRTGRLTVAPGAREPKPAVSTPADLLVGIREIRALFGLGRTAAYELTHRPGVPDSMPLATLLPVQAATFAADLRHQAQLGGESVAAAGCGTGGGGHQALAASFGQPPLSARGTRFPATGSGTGRAARPEHRHATAP